ncbi:MAG: cysteine desulfurase [Candidatus Izemoplasmatales bacterium]|jgi:cysteine desulfurase/selenocysteine lyase|nr:cysteine desulfurase [Candidatus Izemoplasmatales bacterium]
MNKNVISDFPQINAGYIYFDTAATSLKPKQVIEAVNMYNESLSANIHRGMYYNSVKTTELYEESRSVIAKFINANENEIVFTRGTTSSINLVASSYGLLNLKKGDEIIVSEQEHHSQFLPWQNVAKRVGATLRFVELNKEGKITVEAFKKVLSDKTKVVALNYVSNVLGYINDIKEITRLTHEKNTIMVVDAAQAVQHIRVDVKDLDIDFLAFSGHKMLGPTGIGVLYGKAKHLNNLEPVEFGGDMNEDVEKDVSTWKKSPFKFEAGTMPIASVIGLKAAVQYLEKLGLENIHSYSMDLYKYLLKEMNKIEGLTIYNPNSDTGILTYNLSNVPAHDAITYYAEKNIALRSGQHCAKLIHDFLNIHSSLRVTVYFYNTKTEIDRFIEVTKEAIAYFKNIGF